jgi:hypothetical protein
MIDDVAANMTGKLRSTAQKKKMAPGSEGQLAIGRARSWETSRRLRCDLDGLPEHPQYTMSQW